MVLGLVEHLGFLAVCHVCNNLPNDALLGVGDSCKLILLQRYLIGAYACMKSKRLGCICDNQDKVRTELCNAVRKDWNIMGNNLRFIHKHATFSRRRSYLSLLIELCQHVHIYSIILRVPPFATKCESRE